MADYTIKLKVDGESYTVKWKGVQPTRKDVAGLEARIRAQRKPVASKVGAAVGAVAGKTAPVTEDLNIPGKKGEPGRPYSYQLNEPMSDYIQKGAHGGIVPKNTPTTGITGSEVGGNPENEARARKANPGTGFNPGGPLDIVLTPIAELLTAASNLPGISHARKAGGAIGGTVLENAFAELGASTNRVMDAKKVGESVGENLADPLNWITVGGIKKLANARKGANFLDDADIIKPLETKPPVKGAPLPEPKTKITQGEMGGKPVNVPTVKATEPVQTPKPPEPAKPPRKPETVAVHAASQQVRDELGLPEYTKTGKKVAEIVEEAKADPNLADTALAAMEKKARPLTDAETVALDMKGTQLLKERRKLVDQLADARSQGKPTEALEATLAEKDALLNRVLDASDKGGSELGRALGLRAKLAKDKYSPEGIVKEAKAASPKPLTSEQIAQAEDHASKIATLEQRVAQLEKSAAARDADKAVSVVLTSRKPNIKGAIKGELNVKVTKEQFDKALDDLLKPVDSMGAGLGSLGSKGTSLVKVTTHLIERGELTAKEIFEFVKQKVGDSVDDLAIWEAIRVGAGDVGRSTNRGRTFGDDILISGKAGIQSKEVQAARIALDKAKRDADEFIGGLTPAKPLDVLTDFVNIPRTLMASGDVSAWFRQGGVLLKSHPILGVKAMGKSIKPIFSEQAALVIDDIIRNADPAAHKVREQANLYIAPLNNAKILKREETFISKTLNKIPGIGHITRASERTYISYLNKLRADVFDAFAKANPKATSEELADYADFINKATGRGSLGDFEQASVKLANWFFSPRFMVSRFQTPAKIFTARGAARTQVLKDFTAYSGVIASTLYVAHLAGAEVNLNAKSSEFLKMRIGKTVIDPGAGFTQAYRMAARMILSAYDKVQGKEPESPLQIAADFGKYKLSPQVTLTNTLVSGKNMIGQEKTPGEAVTESIIPLSAQEAKEIIEEHPGGKGAALSILNFIGFGTSVYEKKGTGKPKKPSAPKKPSKP